MPIFLFYLKYKWRYLIYISDCLGFLIMIMFFEN